MTMQSFADHCLYVIGYHSGGEIKYVEKIVMWAFA